jgi:hypothetical protein
MAKTKIKAEQISPEQAAENSLKRSLEEIQKKLSKGLLPKNPTRKFNVGDQVQIGAWGTTHVTEVLEDGLIYKVHADFIGSAYGKPVREVKDAYIIWSETFPYVTKEQDDAIPKFMKPDYVRINFHQSVVDSLLHMVYHAGIDFKPDYQRDLVWTIEQKRELIRSMFNYVDIGKFTFIKHDYSRELFYEILDGKQRLTTLCEFYEDRFTYEGLKFSEMCFRDRHHLTDYPIVWGETEALTQKQIYGLFLQLNTTGTPIDHAHIQKVRELYEAA